MVWSIGPVTLLPHEEPDDGPIQFGKKGLWVKFHPARYEGTLRQWMGFDSPESQFRIPQCGEITMAGLEALVGPSSYVFTCPRPKFENGLPVTIDEVDARWTRGTPGEWTAAQIAADLVAHPAGDGFGWYEVIVRFTELNG